MSATLPCKTFPKILMYISICRHLVLSMTDVIALACQLLCSMARWKTCSGSMTTSFRAITLCTVLTARDLHDIDEAVQLTLYLYYRPHCAPFSCCQFPTTTLSPSSRPHYFPSRDMAHRLESARLQALFKPALQAYKERLGVSLLQHPLAINLQSCDTVKAITSLLQDQAQAFRDLQGSDKIMVSIERAVSIVSKISSAAPLADTCGLVRQKGLTACLTSLTLIYRHSHLRR